MVYFVSIIIPVYNVEPYISDCIQSVMRQTYQGSLECILVDDCGTDKSIEVAEKLIGEYQGSIEFKILHHEHNRGLSAARNTGMVAATGDYIYFLDSDDWISDDCIEKLTTPLRLEKFDIVVGNYEARGKKLVGRLILSLPQGKYQEKAISNTFRNNGVYVMAWNKLYRKEFLLQYQLWFEEGKIHEDEILAFELACVDKTFYVVKAVTYYYRIRENSIITGRDERNKIQGYAGVIEGVRGKVKKYDEVEGIYDFYLSWIKNIAFHWISNVKMDDDLLHLADELTEGFLDAIPNVMCLSSKHDRLAYWLCRKNQTYSYFINVPNEYARKWKGRALRNLLNILPLKTI